MTSVHTVVLLLECVNKYFKDKKKEDKKEERDYLSKLTILRVLDVPPATQHYRLHYRLHYNIRCMYLCRSPSAAVLRSDARLRVAPRNVATVLLNFTMFTCVAPNNSTSLDWMEFVTRPEGSLIARGPQVEQTTRSYIYGVRVRGTRSVLLIFVTLREHAGRYACVDSEDGDMGFAELIVLRECACVRECARAYGRARVTNRQRYANK